MKQYDVNGHEPSFLPDGDWELVWSDEFDGTELDTSKWDFRMAMMGKKWPAWTDKGVSLDGNSNVVFTLIEENYLCLVDHYCIFNYCCHIIVSFRLHIIYNRIT